MTTPTAAPVLPYVPAAVRAYLLDAPVFTGLVPPSRIVVDAQPDTVTTPFAVIRCPPAVPIEASAGVWLPLVQVEGYAPPGGQQDPRTVVWRIAAAAAAVLSRARNVPYESMHWRGRVVDGPLTDVDTSRGTSAPLYRALIRAELRCHVR